MRRANVNCRECLWQQCLLCKRRCQQRRPEEGKNKNDAWRQRKLDNRWDGPTDPKGQQVTGGSRGDKTCNDENTKRKVK